MTDPRSRPWALLFFLSLAVNLFLGGMWTARRLGHPRGGEYGGDPLGAKGLGPEAQPAVQRVAAAHRGEIAKRARQSREAKKKAIMALSAEPFDRQKAKEALLEFRTKAAAVDEAVQEAALELAGQLPPAQRQQFARSFAHGRGPLGRMAPRSSGPGFLPGLGPSEAPPAPPL